MENCNQFDFFRQSHLEFWLQVIREIIAINDCY